VSLRRLLLLGWLIGSASPAFAGVLPAPPAPLALTADEVALLADGDVVFRSEDTPLGARTIAVIDVNAPPRLVIDAVLDVGKRVNEVSSLREATVYDQPATTPEELGVRWKLSVVGREIVFHTRYVIDRQQAWCVYALDPAQTNDVTYVDGSYQAYSQGTGSRLVYRSVIQSQSSVPEWLRRWLVTGSLKDQMSGFKARAERAGTGSPL